MSVGGVTISVFGVFAALSLLVFSYVLWKRLRDDFEEEKILTLTIYSTLSFLLGARFFYILTHFSKFGVSLSWVLWRAHPGFSLLGGVLAVFGLCYWWTKERQWDFWLVSDSVSVSFSFSFFLLSLGVFISRLDQESLLAFLFSLLFLGFIFLLARTYRKFIWYKSGKPGFVASIGLAIFSLGFLLLEFTKKNGVSYGWENLGFFWLLLVGLCFLYYRSERNLRQDLKGTKKLALKIFLRKKPKNG